MKKVKFKKNKINKFILTIILTTISVLIFSFYLSKTVSTNLSEYSLAKVNKENLILLKNAFEKNSLILEANDLISVTKNSKNEIVEVNFDMNRCFNFLSQIRNDINNNISHLNYDGYRIDIPVGALSHSPIFMNISPKIPVKVEISDVVLGNVHTEVKSFGINNALIEIYVTLSLNSSVILPYEVEELKSSYDTLLTSKVITGEIPDYIGGYIGTKNDSINLPIAE